jgi:hypothetical protein
VKTKVRFIVAGDIKSAKKRCYATLNIFILLTVTRTSAIHNERIVAFAFQHWLRERATMLRYMHIAYLLVTVVLVLTRDVV